MTPKAKIFSIPMFMESKGYKQTEIVAGGVE